MTAAPQAHAQLGVANTMVAVITAVATQTTSPNRHAGSTAMPQMLRGRTQRTDPDVAPEPIGPPGIN